MTLKAPRRLMHSNHLYSPQDEVERMSEGLQRLDDRLGILLVQLSAVFTRSLVNVTEFAAGSSGFSIGFPQ